MIDHNHIGERFGRLTIIGTAPKNMWCHRMVSVRCDCGTEKTVTLYHVLKGRTVSCGCWKTEPRKKRAHPVKPKSALEAAMDTWRWPA